MESWPSQNLLTLAGLYGTAEIDLQVFGKKKINPGTFDWCWRNQLNLNHILPDFGHTADLKPIQLDVAMMVISVQMGRHALILIFNANLIICWASTGSSSESRP